MDLWLPHEDSGVSVAQTLSYPNQKKLYATISQSSPVETVVVVTGQFLQIYQREASGLYEWKTALDTMQWVTLNFLVGWLWFNVTFSDISAI